MEPVERVWVRKKGGILRWERRLNKASRAGWSRAGQGQSKAGLAPGPSSAGVGDPKVKS